jgi:hypothetical protein
MLQLKVDVLKGETGNLIAFCLRNHENIFQLTLLIAYQVLSHSQDGLDPIRVGAQLGLEGLVLLMLRLNVGRIFVSLFLCKPKYLENYITTSWATRLCSGF